MINKETLQGNWHEIKGLLRSKWGELTEDDVAVFDGNVESLVGTIQGKTGETRDSIEHFFEDLSSDTSGTVSWAGRTMRAGAHHASDAIQDTSQRAAASMRHGYAEVETMVRQRPGESLAVCFAAGLITGLVAGLLLRSR